MQAKACPTRLRGPFHKWETEPFRQIGRPRAARRHPWRQSQARRPVEIFVQREQRIRLHFPENTTEFLLNPVHRVKERPAVDSKLSAAELLVRTQKKMVPEDFVLEIIERSARYEAKIREIFFVLSSPGGSALFATMGLDRNAAQMRLLRRAPHKAVITDPENRPQNAIAGRQRLRST